MCISKNRMHEILESYCRKEMVNGKRNLTPYQWENLIEDYIDEKDEDDTLEETEREEIYQIFAMKLVSHSLNEYLSHSQRIFVHFCVFQFEYLSFKWYSILDIMAKQGEVYAIWKKHLKRL